MATNRRVVSRSEAGNFTGDGDFDMRVLRSDVDKILKWWNNGKIRPEYEGSFGLPFGGIQNDKLVAIPKGFLYGGNNIGRTLHNGSDRHPDPRLSYSDNYSDKRGIGGFSGSILGRITSVRVEGKHLVIEGVDRDYRGSHHKVYRYLIQDRPDDKPQHPPAPVLKPFTGKPDNVVRAGPILRSDAESLADRFERITREYSSYTMKESEYTRFACTYKGKLVQTDEEHSPSYDYHSFCTTWGSGHSVAVPNCYIWDTRQGADSILQINNICYVRIDGDKLRIGGTESYKGTKELVFDILPRPEAKAPAGTPNPWVAKPKAPAPKIEPPKKESPKAEKPKTAPRKPAVKVEPPKKEDPKPKVSAPKKETPKKATPKPKAPATSAKMVFEVRVNGKMRAQFESLPKAKKYLKELKSQGLSPGLVKLGA